MGFHPIFFKKRGGELNTEWGPWEHTKRRGYLQATERERPQKSAFQHLDPGSLAPRPVKQYISVFQPHQPGVLCCGSPGKVKLADNFIA